MALHRRVNRNADSPLYRQVSDDLAAGRLRELAPGDRLPSEADLAAEYDVTSRDVASFSQAMATRFRGLERHWQGDTSLYGLLAVVHHRFRGDRVQYTVEPA